MISVNLVCMQFFTTEPFACEPSSLPKYPPSKEIDAKRRDEEARRYVIVILVCLFRMMATNLYASTPESHYIVYQNPYNKHGNCSLCAVQQYCPDTFRKTIRIFFLEHKYQNLFVLEV
jgi:hypothetical protein